MGFIIDLLLYGIISFIFKDRRANTQRPQPHTQPQRENWVVLSEGEHNREPQGHTTEEYNDPNW